MFGYIAQLKSMNFVYSKNALLLYAGYQHQKISNVFLQMTMQLQEVTQQNTYHKHALGKLKEVNVIPIKLAQ